MKKEKGWEWETEKANAVKNNPSINFESLRLEQDSEDLMDLEDGLCRIYKDSLRGLATSFLCVETL